MRVGFSKMLIPLLGTLAISFSQAEAQDSNESDEVVMQQSRPIQENEDPWVRKPSSPKYYRDSCGVREEEDTTYYYVTPCVGDYGFKLYGDFIYWLPFGLDLDYAVRANATTYTDKSFVKYDWHPGFKVGFGYNGKSAWDFDLYYLYIHPNGSDAAAAGTNEVLISSFDQVAGLTFQQAKSNVRLVYMHGDLDIGRRIFVGKTLSLRFLFGLKGKWIQQHWEAEFFGANFFHTRATNEWDIAGAGPKVGAQIYWNYYDGLGIYGKSSFAAMIVHHDFDYTQVQSTNTNDVNLSYSEHKLAPTVDFEAGLSWGRRFHCNRWGFNLAIGYQLTCWWNVAKRMRLDNANLIDASQPGNLYLQGLVTHAGLDF